MPSDAIVSLPSPGAGRKIDIYGHDGTGGTWGTTNGLFRGGQQAGAINVQVWKGSLATLTGEYYKGRSALGQKCTGASGDYSRYTGFAHNCLCERPLETVPDDFAVCSIRAHLAWDPFGGPRPLDEHGVSLVPHELNASLPYVLGGVSNFGERITFGPLDDNTARIIARNGTAGLTINATYPLTVPVQQWKQWELRAVSATSGADAYVVGYINGKQITDRIKIGLLNQAGTAPPIFVPGFEKGYHGGYVYVCNTAAGGPKMYYGGMNWLMAPTEAAIE